MQRRFLLGAGAAALAATLAGPAGAANSWVHLGTRTINWAVDHDTIPVGMIRAPFDHIMLQARGNAIYVIDLDVTYSNGAPDHIPVRFLIPQGGQTRAINLRGLDRFIRRVDITYSRPRNGRGRAVVDLLGRR